MVVAIFDFIFISLRRRALYKDVGKDLNFYLKYLDVSLLRY